jgi:hypothetical protein
MADHVDLVLEQHGSLADSPRTRLEALDDRSD